MLVRETLLNFQILLMFAFVFACGAGGGIQVFAGCPLPLKQMLTFLSLISCLASVLHFVSNSLFLNFHSVPGFRRVSRDYGLCDSGFVLWKEEDRGVL